MSHSVALPGGSSTSPMPTWAVSVPASVGEALARLDAEIHVLEALLSRLTAERATWLRTLPRVPGAERTRVGGGGARATDGAASDGA